MGTKRRSSRNRVAFAAVAVSLLLYAVPAVAQGAPADAPEIGQVSRDSLWVPTPERLIRRMLQIADTTNDDHRRGSGRR